MIRKQPESAGDKCLFFRSRIRLFLPLRNRRPPTRYERLALTIPLTVAALAAPVQILVDGTDPNTAGLVANYAQGVWSNWLAQEGLDSTEKEAAHAGRTLLGTMEAVRASADELEGVVADDLWPLATYQEMLFIL